MSKKNDKFIPNSFQVPNIYIDEYLHLLSNSEAKVLLYAIRRIFGFQKRTDRISISQFCDGIQDSEGNQLDYGTGLSKATVISSLNKLIEYGLIIKVADNNKKNEGCLYQLSAMPDVDDEAMIQDQQEKQKEYDERMEKARAAKKEGGLSDRQPSNGYTGGGKADRPQAVKQIDTHIYRGKPGENQDSQATPDPEYIPAGHEFDEPEPPPKKTKNQKHKEMVQALMDATELDMNIKLNAGRIYKASKELRDAGYTPDDVRAFMRTWPRDWRYQKDRKPPAISVIQAEIKKGRTDDDVLERKLAAERQIRMAQSG
jgi:hypothetical protein